MKFNHFGQNNKKKGVATKSTDNFFEALKGIGGSVVKGVKNDVVKGVAQNTANTLLRRNTVDTNPGSNPFEAQAVQEQQEQQRIQAEHRRLHMLRQKEEVVFSARAEETKKQIKQLQEELKKLAKELGSVASEVQVAAIQETVEPGTYHVTFFEHLKSLIIALRKKLSDSASWLHTATDRSEKKKKGYWGKVKSAGTKFMLSQERTMATQSG